MSKPLFEFIDASFNKVRVYGQNIGGNEHFRRVEVDLYRGNFEDLESGDWESELAWDKKHFILTVTPDDAIRLGRALCGDPVDAIDFDVDVEHALQAIEYTANSIILDTRYKVRDAIGSILFEQIHSLKEVFTQRDELLKRVDNLRALLRGKRLDNEQVSG